MATVRAAVLVIGSLLWDTDLTRGKWRKERLICSEAKLVRAPIRYGRKSSSRKDTFTMVFTANPEDATKGRGQLIPLKNPITEPNDLITEAQHLWDAEMKDYSASRQIGSSWGCVAVAFNPKWDGSGEYDQMWKQRVDDERATNDSYKRLTGLEDIVTADGILSLSWPTDEAGLQIDTQIILATPTVPSLINEDYASPLEIARAWNDAKSAEWVEYFKKNRAAEITTRDDAEIISHLAN